MPEVAAYRLVRTTPRYPVGAVLKQFKATLEVAEYMFPLALNEEQEVFWALPFDAGMNLITPGPVEIFRGSEAAVISDPAFILTTVLRLGASAFVVVHNHPTDSVEPSDADDRTTQHLVRGAKAVNIGFLDHLIISRKSYFSFGEANRMSGKEVPINPFMQLFGIPAP